MIRPVIKVVNKSNNRLPHYATEGAAGMDLKAFLKEPVKLQPMERVLIPTGIFIELPVGYEAQVRPRSGLAINQGITCLNSPGTVDSDYRGEIKIILINLSAQDQVIQSGDRIAQMVVQTVERATLEIVTELNKSEKAENGFGSTGKK